LGVDSKSLGVGMKKKKNRKEIELVWAFTKSNSIGVFFE
jgi:hypothetical protein